MQELHPTFLLHNGFFRIDNASLKPMVTLDQHSIGRTLQATS